MFSSVQIIHTFNKTKNEKEFKIKEKVEDFIVQEVNDETICTILPILDLEKYFKAENFLKNLPTAELSKDERKAVYSIVNYHPFKRLFTADSKFEVENRSEDIFVFTLMKYDYSANALANLLSRRLDVPSACIQTSGTKDKRGITLQEMSINCSFEKLFNYAVSLSKNESLKFENLGFNKKIDEDNEILIKEIEKHMKVETFEVTEQIMIFNIRRGSSKKLGDLKGNLFTIKIRELFNLDVKSTKFLNYFGTQRFGMNLNNHIVGECILNEQFDEALDIIVADDKNYNPIQKSIIRLREQKNKPKFIVSRIPRHVKMIYLHSFQSLLFNKSVNDRFNSSAPLVGEDKILRNGEFLDVEGSESLEDIYIPLKKMNDKMLKGGNRKMIEEMQDLTINEDSEGTKVRFFLNKSSYATIALRELIGDFPAASFE